MSMAVIGVVGAVGTVAAAGVSAYGQMSAADTAAQSAQDLQNLNPARQALKGFGSAKKLAKGTNEFNVEQLTKYLGQALPGYQNIVNQAFKNTASWVRGRLPMDVQTQIKNASAQQAIGGGYGGSRMSANLQARDLGLSSLQLMQQGQNSAQQWIQMAHQYLLPKLSSPEDFLLNPGQQAQLGISAANLGMQGAEAQAGGYATLGQGLAGATGQLAGAYQGYKQNQQKSPYTYGSQGQPIYMGTLNG